MSASASAALLDRLFQAQRTGVLDIDGLADANGLSLDDALALQLRLLERLQAEGEQLGGWKVGLTSGAALDRMGPGFRPFGFLLQSRIFTSGDRIPFGTTGPTNADTPAGPDSVEGEVCFRIGEAIQGPDVSPDDVRHALSGGDSAIAAGLELNARGRYPGADPGLRIADNMTNWGIVVGDEISPIPADFDFDALEVGLEQDGAAIGVMRAQGHIDDHYLSLSRLVQQLARFGRGLEAGQRVITGAFDRTPILGPTRAAAHFSGIGRVAIQIT